MCVGCLRCTTEHPEWVQIYHNPEFKRMGDSYLKAEQVDMIHYEAQTGSIPVKGAGYRGKFGGEGWDDMWTDMSEIVRPTRDGIHGREYISTVVDLGEKPSFLTFDEQGLLISRASRVLRIQLPILFDLPPASVGSPMFSTILSRAAQECEILAILPVSVISKLQFAGDHVVPLVTPAEYKILKSLTFQPKMVELASWDANLYDQIRASSPDSLICLRLTYDEDFKQRLLQHFHSGIRIFHLIANYHGRGENGKFALDLIREAHQTLVDACCRDEVTLLGSGGIVAAEHVAKAIICGLDAVALDIVLPVALGARHAGECVTQETSPLKLSKRITVDWGVQRIKNLLGSWHGQMLEVLGAMGLREVRRLRGEVGRAMFHKDLEREAFRGITGYEDN